MYSAVFNFAIFSLSVFPIYPGILIRNGKYILSARTPARATVYLHVGTQKHSRSRPKIRLSFLSHHAEVSKMHTTARSRSKNQLMRTSHATRRSLSQLFFISFFVVVEKVGNRNTWGKRRKLRIPTWTGLYLSYTIRVVEFFRIISFFSLFQHTCKTT